ETKEAIKQAQAQKETVEAEFRKSILAEQAEIESRLSALRHERIKAETRTGLRQLRAPIGGVVQQLAVHTVGGVVTPAQALMVIVPSENRLEVEAYIQNKDIGFIEEAQAAEVKVDAFPFTKYGTIDAEIVNVSNDAVENENLGWVFLSRVAMNDSTILVGNRQVNLTPGMSVSVEVKTGKRRIIEFFLSPLLRYKQESIKER
ncbi:MAG: HlyD family type I secretion periplasmic adaptor subunit, partial [Gammaproteobacteria bacterium]